MVDWKASQYLIYKNQRTQPAVDLANRIILTHPEKILDVGCGPGNSTQVLADRYPNASILGVDNSEDMITTARRDHPGLLFQMCDASTDLAKLPKDFNLVFSNACIQWVPDHPKLLAEMMGLLVKGGILAIQVPYNFEEPIHQIIAKVTSSRDWKRLFPSRRIFYTLSQSAYFDILAEMTSHFEVWETTYYHAMPSHNAILEWYRGTGLRPYLDVLPLDLHVPFEEALMAQLVTAYPKQKNGQIIFRFPRLFLLAER